MATERLYYQDAYLTQFDARVTKSFICNGQPAVILSRTAFYPTSGGQPHDTGFLNSIPVLNVYEEEDDDIIHILSAPLQADSATGQIDWPRRFDHMQQHAGQHILSKAFEGLLQAETIGFHISAQVSAVDIKTAGVSPDHISHIEETVNNIIWSNLPIRTFFPSPEELHELDLRKPPAKSDNIRIISIDRWDDSACGGTHPRWTGEIGILVIRRWEKHRSGIRVEFICGNRVLKDFQRKNKFLLQLGTLTSMPEQDIVPAVQKIIDQNSQLEKTMDDMQDQLLTIEADQLLCKSKSVPKVIQQVFVNKPAAELKLLANKFTAHAQVIALLGSSDNNRAHLLFQRSADLPHHMGKLLQQVLPTIGGKGGGSAQSAQGGGTELAKIEEALCAASKNLDTVI